MTASPTKTELAGRELLLEAARDAFLRDGYTNVSMQAVATAAGMTKGAPYYHFKSKEDLFLSVFMQEVERIIDEMLRCLNEPGLLRDRLKAAILGVMETTQGDFNQMFSDFERHFHDNPDHFEHDMDRIDMSENMLPYFREARERGEFSRISAERAVEFFILLLFGQMKFLEFDKARPENYRPLDERANELIDLLFDGI